MFDLDLRSFAFAPTPEDLLEVPWLEVRTWHKLASDGEVSRSYALRLSDSPWAMPRTGNLYRLDPRSPDYLALTKAPTETREGVTRGLSGLLTEYDILNARTLAALHRECPSQEAIFSLLTFWLGSEDSRVPAYTKLELATGDNKCLRAYATSYQGARIEYPYQPELSAEPWASGLASFGQDFDEPLRAFVGRCTAKLWGLADLL
jgi:hypothetical protein